MSRFVLLVLTLSILKNEVKCGTLGRISKSNESLLPRAERELPSHWTRLNSEFPSGNKVLVNTTRRLARSGDTSSKRQAKFFPKFSILAGLDIGGELASRAVSNLTPIAKIVQANTFPSSINPYFSASYDPNPPSSTVQQSIQALYRLVERLRQQMDHFNKNNSINTLFDSEDVNANIVDDRKRRKDKIKKTTSKRKKQEKGEEDDDEEIDYVKPKVSQKVQKSKNGKNSSKNGARKSPNAKQAVPPSTDSSSESGSSSSMEISTETNSTSTNTTNNGTTTQGPGYYYGGNPQNIDNVGFTYDRPQETYGAPADNYGPPSKNYGPPSTSYGSPSYSYGAPSQSYGSPSYSYGAPSRGYGAPYETAHYTAYNDHETIIYDDPISSFGPLPSQRWQQRLPFARSRNLGSTTEPTIANSNGFVPML